MNIHHTPGPWIVANSGGTVIAHNGIKYNRICELEKMPLSITPEIETNAKLIAAAPELLQMVYDLKKCIERLTDDNLELHQEDRDKEAQWIGEAHELLHKINPNYYKNANS